MSVIRKIKRNMARIQLRSDGKKRVNARIKLPNAPSGKIGKNTRYSSRVSNSDFALDWQKALKRRVNDLKYQQGGRRV